MKRKPRPQESIKEKYNGLTSTQEVLYLNEFKRADKAAERAQQQMNHNDPNLKM